MTSLSYAVNFENKLYYRKKDADVNKNKIGQNLLS